MLFFSICVFYIHILIAILKIYSVEGRQKTISICRACFTVILCAYGPVVIIYVAHPHLLFGTVVHVLNNIALPMLDSLIYY
jgi:hypothetical protein